MVVIFVNLCRFANILIILNIVLLLVALYIVLCLCDIDGSDIDSIVRAVGRISLKISEFVSMEYFGYSEHRVFACSILCLCDIDSIVRAVEAIGHNISNFRSIVSKAEH